MRIAQLLNVQRHKAMLIRECNRKDALLQAQLKELAEANVFLGPRAADIVSERDIVGSEDGMTRLAAFVSETGAFSKT